MNKKIVVILVSMLFIATATLSILDTMNVSGNKILNIDEVTNCECFNSPNDCDCCSPCMRSYWKLDGVSGNVIDCYNGNYGVNNGANRGVLGQVNNAFSFNGIDNYVRIPQPYSTSLNLGTFTLEAWINADINQKSSYPTILSNRGKDEYNGFLFGLSFWDQGTPGSLFLQIDGINYISCSTPLNDNYWHHVAVTRYGTSITFYVDGRIDGIANGGGNMNSIYDTWIGWDEAKPSTTPWSGKIDKVAIHGCCLSASTIKCHYQRGLAHQDYCGYCHNHKMHYPQLPDEDGWDVSCGNSWPYLADDWECSESGHVKDIHFWGSWKDDIVGIIDGFRIWIAEDSGKCYPNTQSWNVLWEQYFTDFEVSDPIIPGCLEGWYDPIDGSFVSQNHGTYYQYDIVNISDPFYQQKGEKYWLMITAYYEGDNCSWGWKSSENHWGCDAVFSRNPDQLDWEDLFEPPDYEQSLDLAFVITGGCCIDPPDGLIAWWPLDSPNICQDIADVGPYDGYLACGPYIDILGGKVATACRFKYQDFQGVIRTNDGDDPFEKIGSGDFTIDTWIYPEKISNACLDKLGNNRCEDRIILDNRRMSRFNYGDKVWHVPGITFFVRNEGWNDNTNEWTSMKLGISMDTTEFLSAQNYPAIMLNDWQHVAVTVSRAGTNKIGTFYLNGVSIGTFTPVTGNLFEDQYTGFPRLDIGHASPRTCGMCSFSNSYFNGLLDEIQIFNRSLTPEEIKAIYNADGKGKCKQYGSKMVSTDNGETWNERVNADVDEIVRFKILTVNSGKRIIDNIEVIDILPDCLEYVEGSAEPFEPIIHGNNLTWNYEDIDVGITEEIEFDALIKWQPFEPYQYNYLEISGKSAGTNLYFNDIATVIIGETVPDLRCSGSLSWAKAKSGATVEGNFYVENVGEKDSNLFWDIESIPDWGTWTINPICGENLKPEDGPVEVDVEIVVPDEQNAEFSGEVKIVNRDDPTDYCSIPVSIITPRNREINIPFFNFLQQYPILYLLVQQFLKL